MKTICVLTATRAEYGLLKSVIKQFNSMDDVITNIAVTGAHLSNEFGWTYKQIELDGFEIHKKIPILSESDTPSSISKSMALAICGFADYFKDSRPDLLIVLGDRYETLAVCIAAMNECIPIAHIHGGETTQGAIDEAIRHSITKMSHMHFTSTEEYRKRVIQLGEKPDTVHHVGALGCEAISKIQLMKKKELEESLDFTFTKNTAIFTYHPVTLDNIEIREHFKVILDAIDSVNGLNIIFTKANADAGGRIINNMIEMYANKNKHKAKVFTSLGQLRYYSSLLYADVVIGNSSSGIIETPSFKIPTVNIGERQQGRTCPDSVINCNVNVQEIKNAIEKAISPKFKEDIKSLINPYFKKDTTKYITEAVCEYLNDDTRSIQKKFYDIEGSIL